MAIELTSASKSTRVGILSALNLDVFDIPLLDGQTNMGELLWTNEAAEGTAIPDGTSDTFTLTYNLTRSYPNGAFVVFIPGDSSFKTFVPPSNKIYRIYNYGLSLPALSCLNANGTTKDMCDQLLRGIGTLGGNGGCAVIVYVNTDYTQSRLLVNPATSNVNFTQRDSSGNTLPNNCFGKTYSELNNCLIGYYAGPFSMDTAIQAAGGVGSFTIPSIYISGSTLVLLCKKVAATSSKQILRAGFFIVDSSI